MSAPDSPLGASADAAGSSMRSRAPVETLFSSRTTSGGSGALGGPPPRPSASGSDLMALNYGALPGINTAGPPVLAPPHAAAAAAAAALLQHHGGAPLAMPQPGGMPPGMQPGDLDEPDSPPSGCNPDTFKLFVGNIPKSYTEMQLLPLFETIGKVIDLVIVRDRHTHESKGSAFLWYAERAHAEQAILEFHLRYILPDSVGENNRRLVLRKARSKAQAQAYAQAQAQAQAQAHAHAYAQAAHAAQHQASALHHMLMLPDGGGGSAAAAAYFQQQQQGQGQAGPSGGAPPWQSTSSPQLQIPGPPLWGSRPGYASGPASGELPTLTYALSSRPSPTAQFNAMVLQGQGPPGQGQQPLGQGQSQGGVPGQPGQPERGQGPMSQAQVNQAVHRGNPLEFAPPPGTGSRPPSQSQQALPPPPLPPASGPANVSLLLDTQQFATVCDYLHSIQTISGADIQLRPAALPEWYHLLASGTQPQVQAAKGLIEGLWRLPPGGSRA